MERKIMQFTKDEAREQIEKLNKTWLNFNESDKEKFINILSELEFTSPNKEDAFSAFNDLTPENIRVLIIGQDPYPEIKKACGLAFLHNTKEYDKIDDTLKNILAAVDKSKIKESTINYDKTMYQNWAIDNKVLLLNTSLTHTTHPDKGKPYKNKEEENTRKYEIERFKIAHQNLWRPFIKSVISKLIKTPVPLIVFLWGEDAKNTFLDCVNEEDIDKKLLILSTSHPSNMGNSVNLSFSSDAPKHFELCNDFLKNYGEEEIYWKDLRKIYVR